MDSLSGSVFHDQACDIPILDFEVNALGTVNLLEPPAYIARSSVIFIHVLRQSRRIL